MKHLLWFVFSFAVSIALIASVDSMHSHFVTLLTKPIEKNIAENVARDYTQLLRQHIPAPHTAPHAAASHAAAPHAAASHAAAPHAASHTNDISDYVSNMNHTYTPDEYIEMKSELKNFMQCGYDDTTEIANL